MKCIFNLVMTTCCIALGAVCAKKYAEKSYGWQRPMPLR